MATYTDDFERVDSSSLGSDWANPSWSNSAFSIASGEAVSDSGDIVYWQGGGTWGRRQRSEITINNSDAIRDIIGPAVYVSESGAYGSRFFSDLGSTQIVKWDGTNMGSYSTIGAGIGSGETGGAVTPGDVHALEVNDDGSGNSEIKYYINDTLIATRIDSSSPLTSGNPGMYGDWAKFEAFEGDDFAAAATDTATATVTTMSGTALASETGIDWFWMDTFGANPTDSGSAETTDGTGELVVDLPNTTRTTGQTGYLAVKLSNGNVGISEETVD